MAIELKQERQQPTQQQTTNNTMQARINTNEHKTGPGRTKQNIPQIGQIIEQILKNTIWALKTWKFQSRCPKG